MILYHPPFYSVTATLYSVKILLVLGWELNFSIGGVANPCTWLESTVLRLGCVIPNLTTQCRLLNVKLIPGHHGMALPQVADGEDGLQIWTVAANILNKQLRTAERGQSSSLGVGRGANNPLP
jgi:hypothetical protein